LPRSRHRPHNLTGAKRFLSRAIFLGSLFAVSEIEFERKLNLALVILAVARGRNLTECKRRRVIERTWRGHYTVAAKSGSGEVGVIGKVEELGPEFQVSGFRRPE